MNYQALIRTHHISSMKKISRLRAAAVQHNVGVLIHIGVPGIMYVSGDKESGVQSWVRNVHDLRYKDYYLAVRPEKNEKKVPEALPSAGRLDAVDSVKEFGEKMKACGLWDWWRSGMGYQ
ncbi:hypothetical protein C8J57DRAFT_730367 [Mycena rebaudengoi]|nr:hypothetical protein C8J57DRAFT_730367 [Mycena rebaudengoi]